MVDSPSAPALPSIYHCGMSQPGQRAWLSLPAHRLARQDCCLQQLICAACFVSWAVWML